MDLFKLVGSIFINNKEANSQIDDTNTKAQNLATKIGSAMETAGNKITLPKVFMIITLNKFM